ncbi:MAG: S49 family peptidase, partial [Deltaproteobacteria bacterium]|nr:S49 family peptidase [Deltaproteobacteria bacterium]
MKRVVVILSIFHVLLAAPEFSPAQENIHSQRYSFLSTAGSVDSFGMMINPAGIGFLDAAEMRIFYTSAVEKSGTLTGRGGTFLLAAPLFGGLNAGAGFSLLKDQSGGNYLKSSFDFSYSVKKIISLGLGLRSFASNSSGDISGLFLVDAGFVSMPSDFLSIGFSVSNINRPAFLGSHVERKYRFGAAIQPLGVDLTLAADIETGEESGYLSPSVSLKWEVLKGVNLSAGAIWKKIEDRWEVFSGGLLEFKFGYFAISGGVDAGSNSALSTTFGARFSSDRTSSVTEGDNLLVSIYMPPGAEEDPRKPFPEIRGETFYDFMFKLFRVYKDPRVKGIILYLNGGGLGWAQAEEINGAIKKLAAAGKEVYAYMPSAGMKEYFAALPAKAILVPETGTLNLGGINVTLSYVSELLNKIGVKAQIYPIGKYKNFPEVFNRTSPT